MQSGAVLKDPYKEQAEFPVCLLHGCAFQHLASGLA